MESKSEMLKNKMVSALEAYVQGVTDEVLVMLENYGEETDLDPGLPIGGGYPLAGSGRDGFLSITGVIPGVDIAVDMNVVARLIIIDIANECGRYEKIPFTPTMCTRTDAEQYMLHIVNYHKEHTDGSALAIKRAKEFQQGAFVYRDNPVNGSIEEMERLLSACGEPGLSHCDGVQKVLEYFAYRLFAPPVFSKDFVWNSEDSDQLKLLGVLLKIKTAQG